MSQCKSITRDGTQCTRRALPGRRYCWQHETTTAKIISLGAILTIFLTIIGLLADLRGLGLPIPSISDNVDNVILPNGTNEGSQFNNIATQQAHTNAMIASLSTSVALGQVDEAQANAIFEQLQGTSIALQETATAVHEASGDAASQSSATPTPPTPFSLTLAAQNPKLVALQDVDIRNGPGEEYGVVGTMLQGQEVKLLATSNDYYWRIECPQIVYAFDCWVTGDREYTRPIDTYSLPVINDSWDRTDLWDFEIVRTEKDDRGETVYMSIAHHFGIPYIGAICLIPEPLHNGRKIFPPGSTYIEAPCFDGYVGTATMAVKLAVNDGENVISDQVRVNIVMQRNENIVFSKTFDYYKIWKNIQ